MLSPGHRLTRRQPSRVVRVGLVAKDDLRRLPLLQLLPDRGTLAVLLRVSWMNAKGRSDLLKHYHDIIVAGRLKMLPPGTQDRGHGGTTDFAWFIMRRETVHTRRLVRD